MQVGKPRELILFLNLAPNSFGVGFPPSTCPSSCQRPSPIFAPQRKLIEEVLQLDSVAPAKEAWPERAWPPWSRQRGSLVRQHLALWLRNAGNASSVGLFQPAMWSPTSYAWTKRVAGSQERDGENWPLRGPVGSGVWKCFGYPFSLLDLEMQSSF